MELSKLSQALVVFSLFIGVNSFADLAPEHGEHDVRRCVRIVNGDDFPNVALFGYIESPSGENHETYLINKKNCLQQGYKFSRFKILAQIRKEGVELSQNSIDLKTAIPVDDVEYLMGPRLGPFNPLDSEEIQYEIAEVTDSRVALRKAKTISKYRYGISDRVEIYAGNNEQAGSSWVVPPGYLKKFFSALLLTLLIEVPIVVFLVWRFSQKPLPLDTVFPIAVIASILTLPYVWFVSPLLISDALKCLIYSELITVVCEATIFKRYLQLSFKNALVFSVIANAASFLVGFLIHL